MNKVKVRKLKNHDIGFRCSSPFMIDSQGGIHIIREPTPKRKVDVFRKRPETK